MHLVVLIALMIAIVGTFYPLTSVIVEPITWRNLSGFDETLINEVQLNYLAAALGIFMVAIVANVVSTSVSATWHRNVTTNVRLRDRYTVVVLFIAGTALYGIYVMQVGLDTLISRENFAAKYAEGAGFGAFALGLNIAILSCVWAEGGKVGRKMRLLFRTVGFVIVVWSIAGIAVRSYAATLLIAYLYLYCRSSNIRLHQVKPSLILALGVIWILAEVFSMLRSNPDVLVAMALAMQQGSAIPPEIGAVVGGSEFSHPFITFGEVIRDRSAGDLAGASYIRELIAVVPQRIWPERPDTLAQEFARMSYTEFALRGGGTGFSLLAEGWLNFGTFTGPFLAAAVLASLLVILEKRGRANPDGPIARLLPVYALPVVMAERSSLIVSLKQVAAISIVALVVFATYWLVASPASSLRGRQAMRQRLIGTQN